MESKDLFHVEQRQYMWVLKTVKLLWLGQLHNIKKHTHTKKTLSLYIEINVSEVACVSFLKITNYVWKADN